MKKVKIILSLILAVAIVTVGCGVFNVSAGKDSDLKNEISRLEQESKELEKQIQALRNQNADQKKIAAAIQAKIDNTTQQIVACNNEINKINSLIAQNKEEIERLNSEIEETKQLFRKRVRAIYMNNNQSNVQILLGADNFSDFLQLEQLVASISARDQALLDELAVALVEIESKKAENEKLLNDQVGIKNTILEKQASLKAEQAEVDKIINSLNAQTNSLTQENNNVEAQIRARQKELDDYFASLSNNSDQVYDGNGFYWPVPSCLRWTTYSGHSGIDIPGSYGAPIIASADGVVLTAVTGYGRNPGSTGLASYGNYVVIDHGNKNGVNYKTYSAHMSSVAVRAGQTVKQGQVIGYVGNSGNTWGATGTHLHFEIRLNNKYTNPINYLRK